MSNKQIASGQFTILFLIPIDQDNSCEASVSAAITDQQTRRGDRKYYRLFRRWGKRYVCHFHFNSSTNDRLDMSYQ